MNKNKLVDGVHTLDSIIPEEVKELSLEKLIASIVYRIASYPEEAKVKLFSTSRVTVMEFDLHPKDRGPFLGSDGRTVRSLRTITKALLGPLSRSRSIRIDLANDAFED